MKIKERSIFIGSSHFQGFGLEYELHPRYQDVLWLEENGVHGPSKGPRRYSEDEYFVQKNRWTYLLSEMMRTEEMNIHENPLFANGNSIRFLNDVYHNIIDLWNVKNIFLEFNGLVEDGLKLRNQDKLIDIQKKLKESNDDNSFLKGKTKIIEFHERLNQVKEKYPNIKFWIINTFGLESDLFRKLFKGDILEYYGRDGKNYKSLLEGCFSDKHLLSDSCFCFTHSHPTWDYTVDDIHLNKKGNEYIARMYFLQITNPSSIISYEEGKTFI